MRKKTENEGRAGCRTDREQLNCRPDVHRFQGSRERVKRKTENERMDEYKTESQN